MTSNRPSRSASGGSAPPETPRSARQRRIAAREANRTLARTAAGGSGNGPLWIATIAASLIAVIAVGALVINSQPKPKQPPPAPIAPIASALTPSDIHSDGLTLGNPNAPHTLDLYEDFQCPRCRDFTADVKPQIVATYVKTGQVKIVWHDFLVTDLRLGGTESLDAANAARCAADQGQFWLYHDWLFANQYGELSGAFAKDRLKTIGRMAGIKDLNTFNACVDNGTHDAEVKAEDIPSTIDATPTLMLDGKEITNYLWETVSAALNDKLGITPSPSAGASTSASASASQ